MMDDQDLARIHGQLSRQIRFLLDRWKNMSMSSDVNADDQRAAPTVSITLTCPYFDGSPLIAALSGFDELTGCSEENYVGKNLSFMSDGCDNDPQTVKVLQDIQASPQAALDFLKTYPHGKQFLLLNKRSARTQPTYPKDEEINEIFFFTVLNIFAVKMELRDETYPVLVGVQWVLMHPTDLAFAQQHTRLVQSMLTNPDGDLKEMFLQWVRVALVRYIGLCNENAERLDPTLEKVKETRQQALPPEGGVSLPEGSLSNQVRTLLQRVHEAEQQAQEQAKSLDGSEKGSEEEQIASLTPEEVEKRERAKARATMARAQLEEFKALLQDVCTNFQEDLEQHVAWYVVPATLMQAKESQGQG
jgi:hypothetical protein